MVVLRVMRTESRRRSKAGEGMQIRFGFHPSPFGRCLLALCGDAVCHLSFVAPETETETENLRVLRRQWPGGSFARDRLRTGEAARKIFGGRWEETAEWRVLARGTPFEEKVWRALLTIPRGVTASYQEVARTAGRGAAVRAAANAIAKNPVAYLIPCHRAIGKDGRVHGYRWGVDVRERILRFERRSLR